MKRLTLTRPNLSVGECARICDVAPRTVCVWFDSGELVGYRLPGSLDRRVPRENLIRFMNKSGMPTRGLGAVVVVGFAPSEAARLVAAIGEGAEACDLFRAGQLAAGAAGAVVSDSLGRTECAQILDAVARGAVVCGSDVDPASWLPVPAFREPCDPAAVARAVAGATTGG